MNQHPAAQRCLKAIEALATGTEPIQERVGNAWAELMHLSRNDLPDDIQPYFATVESEMLNAPDDLSTLRDGEAAAAAGRIVQLSLLVFATSGGSASEE